jgi:hypothetical protein
MLNLIHIKQQNLNEVIAQELKLKKQQLYLSPKRKKKKHITMINKLICITFKFQHLFLVCMESHQNSIQIARIEPKDYEYTELQANFIYILMALILRKT